MSVSASPSVAPPPPRNAGNRLAPAAPLILGAAGLLPFALCTATLLVGDASWVLYGWSVIPALIGWAALSIGPPAIVVLTLIAGFAVQYLFDLRRRRALDLPRWFVPLRGVLSTVAVICLGVAVLSSL